MWAHHPHVMQTWEIITVERSLLLPNTTVNDTAVTISEQCKVFCMYSMGNFISGQRWHTRYDDPEFYREYTGDAVMLQLMCTRNEAGRADFSVTPLLITQYNEPEYPVVKRFTQEWIDTLNEKDKKYFTKRFELMKEYLPINSPAE
nr:CapA family protein [Treponema vincentii]